MMAVAERVADRYHRASLAVTVVDDAVARANTSSKVEDRSTYRRQALDRLTRHSRAVARVASYRHRLRMQVVVVEEGKGGEKETDATRCTIDSDHIREKQSQTKNV